eukprot:CAMPEP_0170513378 /NCGR_PEP_ID=MMETSP0208-20121228/67368_1 /TAXON_ID=197538 /ORGANISM="Strombidium inclinatum, Strain S3" /LENGTH=66 /DNA_ID=CAMNT_0010797103 /DNA_START=2178 /DNA_END=2378 /DNA_ORIENTATION=+
MQQDTEPDILTTNEPSKTGRRYFMPPSGKKKKEAPPSISSSEPFILDPYKDLSIGGPRRNQTRVSN